MPEHTASSQHLYPPTARVVAIVGPTASGKSAVAEEVAVRLKGEIVSADSMQVYRGMDIGTAKVPLEERRVPHHCLDLVDPGEPYSAALFQRAARAAFADIWSRGMLPVLAGGTGLYVRAAVDDLEFPSGEQEANPVRQHYERIAEEQGALALHAELERRDPESAALIHPNNTRRVVRALEMAELGVSYAQQVAGLQRRESVYDARFFGMQVERAVLYERIDARVDQMIEDGLLGEVEELLRNGFREQLTAQQAIGYKELVPVIEGSAALDEAVADIKQASRRYAKRQLTWFRADSRVTWIDATSLSATDTATAVVAALDWSNT